MRKVVFISYSSEDRSVAEEISDLLDERGIGCWIAPRDLRPGHNCGEEIISGIETTDVMVLILSEHANQSVHVRHEVERAVSKGKPVLVIRVGEAQPAESLECYIFSSECIDGDSLQERVDDLVVRIHKLSVTFDEMRTELQELEFQRKANEALSDDPEQRLLLAGQGRNLVRRIERLLAEQSPDQQEIRSAMRELRLLVFPPPDDMYPPRSEFRALIEECDGLLDAFSSNLDIEPLRRTLREIEKHGGIAFTTKNRKMWSAMNDNLRKLHGKFGRAYSGDAAWSNTPPTPLLKDHFRLEVEQLRSDMEARREDLSSNPQFETTSKPQFDEIEHAIDQMLIAIDEVDDNLESNQGLARLLLVTRTRETLHDRITPRGILGPIGPAGARLFDRPIGSWELPMSFDAVHFTVSCPRGLAPGTSSVIDVWAHLDCQRDEVIARASCTASKQGVQTRSKGPVKIERGTVLTVRLQLEGFVVDDPEDTILWEGEIGNASFLVAVPSDIEEGPRTGTAVIMIHGLRVARLYFELWVKAQKSMTYALDATEERYRKAFASYASADRAEVLARIQGIQKAAPDLTVFLDVASLRSGQYWETELWNVIPSNDIFYLFWSDNAARSEWVEKEWRCALESRGLDFIDPVPLASPEEVPPPKELASKHFNDWVLAYMRGAVPADGPPA